MHKINTEPGSTNKRQRLIEVAKAYYLENRLQADISRSLGISRSQVSRYLSEARELGIVQIRIVAPDEQATELAEKLHHRYPHLQDVIVAPIFENDPETIRTIVGRYAANYLSSQVRERQRILLGCGRTLREMVKALPHLNISGIEVVQAMGNLGHEAHQIDYNEIARDAAAAFGGRAIYLSAPAILGNGSGTAEEFVGNNPMLARALELARDAQIAVVGLGSMESDQVYSQFGLIDPNELTELAGHVVGDICGQFFDINGVLQPSAFLDRIVGIRLEKLRTMPKIIGVAGGDDKAAPLLGAIRGQLINVVISDEQTIRSVLTLDDAAYRL